MIIKKYPQSHLVVLNNNSKLVIDPGNITFNQLLPDGRQRFKAEEFIGANGYLITHQHADHMDPANIKAVVGDNPVFGNLDVVTKLSEYGIKATAVSSRQKFSIGEFDIETVDLPHCKMVDGSAGPPNTGFLINDIFFHPGDGIELKDFSVDNLALPIAGPSIDFEKAVNFAKALKAKLIIPIHYNSRFAADPKQLQALLKDIKVVSLDFGEEITIE